MGQVQCLDRRLHPLFPFHFPVHVDLQGRIRRIRTCYRAQEVLLKRKAEGTCVATWLKDIEASVLLSRFDSRPFLLSCVGGALPSMPPNTAAFRNQRASRRNGAHVNQATELRLKLSRGITGA